MSVSILLLAVFLILLGVTWLGWVAVSTPLLGLLAFVTGIVLLVDSFHPIVVKRP